MVPLLTELDDDFGEKIPSMDVDADTNENKIGNFGDITKLHDIALPTEPVEEGFIATKLCEIGDRTLKSYELCDNLRLKRFLFIGTGEIPAYDTTKKNSKINKFMINNIFCLQRLLKRGRHEVVLDNLVEYAKARCVKNDILISVFALCAEHEFPCTNFVEIRKAAYKRVPEICTLPTMLFQFVDLTSIEIEERRKKNLPLLPQNWRGKKSKNKAVSINYKEDRPLEKPVFCDGRKSAGWGRMRRKSVAKFYEDEEKDACRLAYLTAKYRRRSNYTHAHLIKYSHPQIENDEKKWILEYLCHGIKSVQEKKEKLENPVSENESEVIKLIEVIDEVRGLCARKKDDIERLLRILDYHGKQGKGKPATTSTMMEGDAPPPHAEWQKNSIRIIREYIPTEFFKRKEVCRALFMDMPMTAMIQNIGLMASTDLFDDELVVDRLVLLLADEHKLKAEEIHPMKILIGKIRYEGGQGNQGNLTWEVNMRIVDALDTAFRKSIWSGGAYRTGKKLMLCLNVSTVMTRSRGCSGCKVLSPAMASCALAFVAWNLEDDVELVAFGGEGNIIDLKDDNHGFHKDMPLQDALDAIEKIELGSTDCGLPMSYALERNIDIDAFVIYTDSQPHCLGKDPSTELQNYNNLMNRDAKLIVCGMASSGFTIADPDNPNMLDIVGFDLHVPELIREFVLGNLSDQCGVECYECEARRYLLNP